MQQARPLLSAKFCPRLVYRRTDICQLNHVLSYVSQVSTAYAHALRD